MWSGEMPDSGMRVRYLCLTSPQSMPRGAGADGRVDGAAVERPSFIFDDDGGAPAPGVVDGRRVGVDLDEVLVACR